MVAMQVASHLLHYPQYLFCGKKMASLVESSLKVAIHGKIHKHGEITKRADVLPLFPPTSV